MIRFLLSLFKPFRGLIERSGADFEQFIRILELKLTIDDRKQSKKRSGSTERSLILQSLGQMAMGLAFAMVSIRINESFTFYYLMHTILMVMMAMMIISEFTTILFDTSENTILQPLPVKGNTLSLARNAHVFVYLALIAVNISLATFVIGIIKFGIVSGLLFLLTVFFNVLFTLFLANILYLGLMHFATGEQLKNVLMYFQIAIAILFMAGYQFGMQMIDKSDITNLMMHVEWYTYLIPSAVFAGFIESVSAMSFYGGHLIFILEALVLPFLAIYITTRFLTPVFNRKLLHLESGDKATKVKAGSGKTSVYYRIMEKIFTRNSVEKASFQLAWRMSGYERLFKQSFFPSLGYVIIMIAVQFVRKDLDVSEIQHSERYLLVLYALMLISFTLSNTIQLGNNRNVGWIFKILPVESPAQFFKGFIKAVFVRFFNPFYYLLSIGVIAFWGIDVLPDVIIAWMAIYLCTLIMFFIQGGIFPFSQPKSAAQGGKNMLKVFALMAVSVLLGFGHYFLIQVPFFGHLALFLVYGSGILITNKYGAGSIIKWKDVDISSAAD